jgi:hypothetical protein
MRAAPECVLSRGPWLDAEAPDNLFAEGIELMWDDGSDAPYALYLTPASFYESNSPYWPHPHIWEGVDLLPAEPEAGREWLLTVWTAKDGKPHKSLERKCHWRRVPRIPWLKPWSAHA